MRKPITIEDHESARFITAPLRLLDYCLINDGAVCMILTTKERAKDFRKPPVLISGFGAQETFSPSAISNFDMDFWYPAVKAAGEQARGMAGVTHDDIDALMCYDNFTPTVLFSLEGLGFCQQGEAGRFVEDGTLQPRRPAADQHRWRPPVQLLHAGLGAERRGGAPAARRMRRPPGAGLRGGAIRPGDALHPLHHLHARLREAIMSYNKPLPKIDTLNKPFWDAAKQGRLVVQHCTACDDLHFPPGPVCPQCLSSDQDWQDVSAAGDAGRLGRLPSRLLGRLPRDAAVPVLPGEAGRGAAAGQQPGRTTATLNSAPPSGWCSRR